MRNRMTGVAFSVAVMLGMTGESAVAQDTSIEFTLSAQPLSKTLLQFGELTSLQIFYSQDIVEGHTAPALIGSFQPDEGLRRILAGTGIVFRRAGKNVTLSRPPSSGTTELAPVTVHGQFDSITEGTGSYTSNVVGLGKGTQTIREIPQSVTVVTQQRIFDQNMTSIGDVMEQTTGITVVGGNGGEASGLYSRGFQISSMQVDGSPVDAFSQSYFNPNLAMYDSVQIVRGADGLFSGTGEPGGSINLVRKRPTFEPQFIGTTSVGSWNQRRVELDASGPLAADGKLRGRAVIAHDDREFFYDVADSRKTFFYGIVEADVTSSTKLTLGANYEKGKDRPWGLGLPRAAGGADLGLSRHTSFMADWNRYEKTNREVFAQIDQQLGGDWTVHASASYIKLDSYRKSANGFGPIDARTGDGLKFDSYGFTHSSEKKNIDINANGSFDLLGRRHHLLVGGDWQDVSHQEAFDTVEYPTGFPSSYNIRNFDSGAFPHPSKMWMSTNWPAFGAIQKGLYARLKLSLTDRLTAIGGARYANYKYESPSFNYDRDGNVTRRGMSAYSESGILTPYGGLVYDLNDRWTIYGSVSEIHKSQANRLQGPLPGAPLDAITGRNYEVGTKGEFNDGRLTTALALYRIERKGGAIRDPNYPSTAVGDLGLNCCWIAQGKVVSQGVDLEVSGALTPAWQVFGGYTYNHNSDKVTGTVYSSITPRHLFRLWTTYRLPDDLSAWTLGAGVSLQSAHHVKGTVNAYNQGTGKFDGPSSAFKFSQPGYAVWNASVQYRFHRNWTALLNVNNLFDRTYYQTMGTSSNGNWYGEPRNAMLTLRGEF